MGDKTFTTSECGDERFTLAEMIDANAEDDGLIEWLGDASVGATFDGIVTVTRVS